MIDFISWIIASIRQKAGDDGIALGIFTVTSMVLVLGMNWANSVVASPTMKVVNGFLNEQLDKAKRIFQENKQDRFQGIRLVTVQIAVILGFACYLWTKVAIKIPDHWPWTSGLLLLILLGFVVAGRWHSPKLRAGGYRFLLISAGSGMALGAATIILDGLTGLVALAIAFAVAA